MYCNVVVLYMVFKDSYYLGEFMTYRSQSIEAILSFETFFFFFFSPRTHPQLTPLLYLTSGVDGYYRTLCLLTPSGIHYLSSSHTFSHLFLQMNPVFLPLLLLLLLFRLWCSLLQASSLLVLLILFLTFKLRVFGFTTCLTTNWSLLMCSDEALNNSEHNWRFI